MRKILKPKFYSRRSTGVLLLVGVLVGATVSGPVAAAPSTKVTWKISFLSAGEAKKLSAVVSTNSPGAKTWSKKGSCTLTPTRMPTKLTMGATGSCELILKITQSRNYLAKISRKTITLVVPATSVPPATTVASTTTVVPATTTAPTTTTTTVAPTTTTTTTTVALTCAQGGSCTVGVDTGPGGGTVFYYSSTAFTSIGSSCNTNCHYLEAAPVTGSAAWTDVSRNFATNATTEVVGADGTAIGTGYKNTLDIIAQIGNAAASSAAVEANAYRGPNNKTDWFLPSRYELNQLCRYAWNLTVDNTATTCSGMSGSIRAGFSNDEYWSSSEVSYREAMVQTFPNGVQFQPFKANAFKVRPVRVF
jgi:hypothetical protein